MSHSKKAKGFTLIELILVMAVLSAVMAVSAPLLSRFFSGRGIEEDVRRFVAVTRHARNEAISRSVMMEVWIRAEENAYGLRPAAGFGDLDAISSLYRLNRGVRFEFDAAAEGGQEELVLLFWPDGSIDDESPENLWIVDERSGRNVEIARGDYGAGYAVRSADEDDE